LPVATGGSYTIEEDEVLTVISNDLLVNAVDTDGDVLSPVLLQGPKHGEIALASDGNFSYAPTANFHGSDSFTYQVTDGQDRSNVVTIELTVQSVNDVPLATSNRYSVDIDTTLVVSDSGVLANDSDVDGDVLTAVLLDGPANGILAFNPDGSFTYTPHVGFAGVDRFTYVASDGLATSAPVTVSIHVINYAAGGTASLPDPIDNSPLKIPPKTGDFEYVPSHEGQDDLASTPASSRSTDGSLTYSSDMLLLEPNDEELFYDGHQRFDWSQLPQREAGFSMATPEPGEYLGYVSEEGLLWTSLDELNQRLGFGTILRNLLVGSALMAATVVSIVYTLWTVWGGYLLTSVLSLMPGWKLLDPLPVLELAEKREESDDDKESLASMIDNDRSRPTTAG
jgi:hypothetical protein